MNDITASPVVISPFAENETLHLSTAREMSFNLTSRTRLHLFYGGIFSLLVLLNFALLFVTAAFFFYSDLPGPNVWLFELLIGVHLGQWVLVAIWMSLGCFRTPWRQLICTMLVFGGSCYLGYAVSASEMSLPVALMVTAITWLMYAALATLRMLTY